jgi:YegS/Rv2252/BmrU family lipid kinase
LGGFGHAFTERSLHAQTLTQRAVEQGYERIIAVGGDGTLNEVVNGLMESGPGKVQLGLVPRGTGGDFRRTFGWKDGVREAFVHLRDALARPLDVGRVEYTTREGMPGVRYFANVCSFGASGRVAELVNAGGRALGGKVGFLWSTVRALAGYRDQRVRLTVDASAWEEADVTTVAVANGRFFGAGMCVAPGADVSDGLFDVTIWSGYGLVDLALKAPSLYSGSHVRLSGTRTLRCRTLRAESDGEVLIDCDGEGPGRLPVQITILPGALQLLG